MASGEQPESTPARELRIEHIAELMRACKWRTGVTGKMLAKELGLAYQTIRLDAAIASRRVYAEVMQDREAIGAKVGSALEKALDGALDEQDWKAVAQLSKVYADASGVSAPAKFEGTIDTIGPEAASRLIREKFGQHAAKREPGDE
jgi:hypothetical protein